MEEAPACVARPGAARLPLRRGPSRAAGARLEGGHSVRRIVHAGGSATGRRLLRELSALVVAHERVQVLEGARVSGLLCEEGRCDRRGVPAAWRDPPIADRARAHGAGSRGGVEHGRRGGVVGTHDQPTGLDRARAAARARGGGGAGGSGVRAVPPHGGDRRGGQGRLPDHRGDPGRGRHAARRGRRALRGRAGAARRGFARDPEPTAGERRSARCSLDMRAIDPALFPNVVGALREAGLDPTRELVPVAPAAHYTIGGVVTDLHGRSGVAGLYAVGETACTGLHGANRLASNSLSECFVFGRRAALAALEEPAPDGGESADTRRADVTAGAGCAVERATPGRRCGSTRGSCAPPTGLRMLLAGHASAGPPDRARGAGAGGDPGTHTRSDHPSATRGWMASTWSWASTSRSSTWQDWR